MCNFRRHVRFRWVSTNMFFSDPACRSLMGRVSLRWSMSRSPMGLRWVSNSKNIFVNSKITYLLTYCILWMDQANEIVDYSIVIKNIGFYGVHENIIIMKTIGDPYPYAWSESHWRPKCLIGALSETHRGPTYLIGDPLETSTCFIGDLNMFIRDLDMLHQRPIWNRHAPIHI